MKKYLLGLGIFFICFSVHSQSILSGKVINAKTKEPLPFVNVTIKNSTRGTTSDVEGKFKLAAAVNDDIIFSFVGFDPFAIHINAQTMSPVTIYLKDKTTELNEVVVRPEDNPALKIIRKVIQNKRSNDPESLPSFSYHSYNKLYMTMGQVVKDSNVHERRSLMKEFIKKLKKKKTDSTAMSTSDSNQYKMSKNLKDFATNSHIFMSESYTERKYVRPNLSKETVLGNQLSGVKDPFFAFMATDFQPFSFYKDYIPLFDVNYLNPISPGSDNQYDFTLIDTVFHGADSVYIISFEPLIGKSFQALKGQLYINTDGYAIEHVLAETADPKALIEFHIQQKYNKIDGHWFPDQLNSELVFKEYRFMGMKPKYIARSYLSDIKIGETIPKKEFGLLNVEFDPLANRQKEQFWQLHRPDSLDAKEKSTYKFYKNKSGLINKLNTSMKIVEGIIVGRFRVGPLYIPLDYLGRVNKYEGLRVGLGAETGERISRFFVLSGYAAYGFKDKAVKYGGGLQLNLIPNMDGFVKFSYGQDVSEPGTSNFIKNPIGALNNESLRNYRVYRMDSVRQYKFEFDIKPIRFSQVALFAQQQQRNPAYQYSYITEKDALGQQKNFVATEVGLQWRFAWKENYTQIGNSKVITNVAYPQFNLVASKGLAGTWNGEYNFTKVEAKLDERWVFRGFGTTTIQVDGGVISGKVPYPFLFNGKGSNYNNSFLNSFVIPNYFQTMGFYEFASNQYADLFINHNFGRLTGTKSVHFRPELEIVQNMGIGSLNNLADHQGIVIKSMNKGFLESGFVVKNIIRFKDADLFYLGFGVGAFFRYGYYTLPKASDNLALKFQVTASF